jgi:hypothetical protein
MDGGSVYMSYGGEDGGSNDRGGMFGGDMFGGDSDCTLRNVFLVILVMWVLVSYFSIMSSGSSGYSYGSSGGGCGCTEGFANIGDLKEGFANIGDLREGAYMSKDRMSPNQYSNQMHQPSRMLKGAPNKGRNMVYSTNSRSTDRQYLDKMFDRPKPIRSNGRGREGAVFGGNNQIAYTTRSDSNA